MTTPGQPITALTDQENVQMEVVEDTRYDVATGYALLANAPLPPVVRGEDLES
jgi:hypothetical protein